MENRLHHLNKIIDNEMSKTPVFTEKDEQNVLAAIKSTPPTRMANKKKTVVPKLLTAALFAGIIFTSYTVIDNYLTPETAIKEKKPETRYAQEFTQASSKITYDVSTRELTIEGTVKNTTNFNSEPFQARVNVLKNDLSTDLGTNSLNLDVPSNNVLSPDEPYSFEKVINLDLGIVDENTFKDAIQIEIFSKTKTLTSFVITNVEYKIPHGEKPVEENEVTSEKDTTNAKDKPEESVIGTKPEQDEGKNQANPIVKEDEIPEPSLAELEQLYGKKKTPFGNVPVEGRVQNQTFYLNGITLGMTKEETLQILGPYDKFSKDKTNKEDPSSAQWKMVTADKNSIKNDSEFSIVYNADQKVNYISFFTLHNSYVEEWEKALGEPYHVTEYGETFYYFKETKQMLSLDAVYYDYGYNHYDVTLWHEENPEEYKNAVD
ncbi:hypothetical protein M3196_08215 [Fictibacillus nanhaiensis]|uniref:hypothetical protein n=1 Tax=Fictibacillus nanhaiensis TaxID=742169 RepID=UPI00203D9AE3|nr:hypothetical protein [Fictibacillus nanhaiensis]MCM3731644.1 hypothetical protein [Fictibacillus nanhaiensis]